MTFSQRRRIMPTFTRHPEQLPEQLFAAPAPFGGEEHRLCLVDRIEDHSLGVKPVHRGPVEGLPRPRHARKVGLVVQLRDRAEREPPRRCDPCRSPFRPSLASPTKGIGSRHGEAYHPASHRQVVDELAAWVPSAGATSRPIDAGARHDAEWRRAQPRRHVQAGCAWRGSATSEERDVNENSRNSGVTLFKSCDWILAYDETAKSHHYLKVPISRYPARRSSMSVRASPGRPTPSSPARG